MLLILRRIESVVRSSFFRSFHSNSTMAWLSNGVNNADLMNQLEGNYNFDYEIQRKKKHSVQVH